MVVMVLPDHLVQLVLLVSVHNVHEVTTAMDAVTFCGSPVMLGVDQLVARGPDGEQLAVLVEGVVEVAHVAAVLHCGTVQWQNVSLCVSACTCNAEGDQKILRKDRIV